MTIIDAHTHPVMSPFGREARDIHALIKRGRALGIGLMVGLGDVLLHGREVRAEQIAEINDASRAAQALAPDYLRFFCFVNPTLGAAAVVREVDRCVGGHGFIGIKLEICNNARDRCMEPVMDAARKWRVPILQHAWSQTNLRQRSYHSDPEDVALLARRHPDVSIIMAHLTGCGVRGVLAIRELPNVVIDTSGGLAEAGLIEYAVQQLGAERVLFGSDLPGRDPAVALHRVLGARISEVDRRRILHDNAVRLLKLGAPAI